MKGPKSSPKRNSSHLGTEGTSLLRGSGLRIGKAGERLKTGVTKRTKKTPNPGRLQTRGESLVPETKPGGPNQKKDS